MNSEGLSFRFCSAIARRPGRSVVNGLREDDRGAPDYERYLAEHEAYLAELEEAGLTVHLLPALEAFPDSVFVEDTALCLPAGVVILNPGAPSRRGEAGMMASDCRSLGLPVHEIGGPGTIDGGDILLTDREILVGLSRRTSHDGFMALRDRVEPWGYRVRAVQTPGSVLHFKTDCCVLGPNTVYATPRLSTAPCFDGYDVIETPPGEEAAANCIRVNDRVLVPAGYPATERKLSAAGYDVRVVPASQAALLDGGLSCQSLRF
ncbi:MAG: dimethylargininase [Xanthomonadales bacterium]|jgi:dimethylargininase|nr:dimethylargininase [Xanthomonadales bacterium]